MVLVAGRCEVNRAHPKPVDDVPGDLTLSGQLLGCGVQPGVHHHLQAAGGRGVGQPPDPVGARVRRPTGHQQRLPEVCRGLPSRDALAGR